MEISNWFKGFEKGIARLSPEERSAFFSECGKNCVNGGTLSVYNPYLCGRNRNKKNNIGNRKDIIATFAFKNVIDINDEE